ncbi:SNARE-binding exocyst subunit S6 [Boothiomyces sp. JEL0866]|nr:SNARE-binding exocyst subunit S6 [Boothiomyces sp. JEL0866]
MDINGVDFVADAHEAAVLRIVDMLRHPDDLTSKLPTLRKKIAMERASVEAQLKTVMETQLDSTQKGIDYLEKCREETNTIKSALQNMDEICGDSENHIRNYSFIQKISRAHQNFTTTKSLVEKFQKINSQMTRVSKLLDDDSKRIIGHAENLLLIHYNIQQLSIFRSKILSEARGLSSDVLNTLNVMFKKLDQLEYKFESYFWELAKNSIELVKADFPSTVVRIIKIIEVEEKLDEAISIQDFSEDMSGEAYDQLRGRQIKGYRIKYFDLLRDKINEEMKKTYLDNQKELSAVLKSFDSIIDTLMFVHDDIAPLYPARYNIFHFFVLEYHRAIYNMVNTMTEGEIEPAVILILIKWVRDYYSSMSMRLDVSEDLLEPRLLDGREDEFMESYVKLVRGKLSEWLKNILKTETVDFLERKNPPEMDTTEQYLFTGSVIVFQMFNQQLDVVAGTSRGQLLSEIVTECCCIMEEFQAAWIKIIDLEYNKFTHKQADLNEGLVEYIMALANDCMRSTEFSDTISSRLETMSDEQYKAQNLSNWYEQDIMKLIVGTFEDYGDDFQKHMSEYLNNKLTTELVDRFLVAYVESFKNKNAKFKMPSATDRMRQDLDSLISFFSRSKNAKRVKASFEVIEKIIGLVESNPRMLYIDFYSLWKQFPDMPLDFVEKVLSKRDDLDKSQVREIMELCRSKTKDERTEDTPPTIFSKISK